MQRRKQGTAVQEDATNSHSHNATTSSNAAGAPAAAQRMQAMHGMATFIAALLLAIVLAALLLLLGPHPSTHHAGVTQAGLDRFAGGLQLPYYSVIFTSQRLTGLDEAGYAAAAQRMVELATLQPGFLGVESTRGPDGFGITVSYWRSLSDIAAWRQQLEHAHTRDSGRRRWYNHYELRVAKVERAYGWDALDGHLDPPLAAKEAWQQDDA